jgi:hypothetical protein
VFYSEYGLSRSYCNSLVLSQLNLEPDPSVVSDDNRGSSEGSIVGGHWGLYGFCDVLSSNVVLSPTGKFGRDAVFFL